MPPELTLTAAVAAAAWLGGDGVFSAKITFLGMNENHKILHNNAPPPQPSPTFTTTLVTVGVTFFKPFKAVFFKQL